MPQRVLVISGSGASATLRYRVRLPEESLRGRGARTAAVHFTDRRARALAELADVVVLYRVPGGAETVELLTDLRRRPRPPLVTYDVDDLVFREEHLRGMRFLDDLRPEQRALFERDVRLRGRLVPYADVVTGSTAEVLDELALLTDAPRALLPNGVGRVGLSLADRELARPRPDAGGLRIGYFSGSATHDADWLAAEPGVTALLDERPDAELWLVGQVRPSPALARFGDRVRRRPLVEWTDLPRLLREVDVAVAPLEHTAFAEAKSAIKWLEAALVATPTVATPTPPFRVAVDHGRTGLFADSDEEWLTALRALADDPGLRREMGERARASALATYGPQPQADRLLAVLRNHEPGGIRRDPTDSDSDTLPRLTRPAPVLLARYPWPPDVADRTFAPTGRERATAAATLGAGQLAAGRARATKAARRARFAVTGRVRRALGRPAPHRP